MRYTCVGCHKREILLEDDDDVPKGTTVRLVDKNTAMKIELQAYENSLRRRRDLEAEDG